MTAPARTRREKARDRERAILAAAREVFVEHGFDGARVAEIGRRAGIAEGTVYLYYRTKSDLMEGVLAAFWTGLTDDARAATSGIADAALQLRRLAEFHMDRLIADYAFLDLAAKLRRWRNQDPASRVHVRGYALVFDEVYGRCINQGLARGTAPVWTARDLFFGTLEYSSRTVLQGDGRGRAEVVDNLMDLLLVESAVAH